MKIENPSRECVAEEKKSAPCTQETLLLAAKANRVYGGLGLLSCMKLQFSTLSLLPLKGNRS
jgi:hypothetical protein